MLKELDYVLILMFILSAILNFLLIGIFQIQRTELKDIKRRAIELKIGEILVTDKNDSYLRFKGDIK